MITNGVPFQFGPGATFRRCDGVAVSWESIGVILDGNKYKCPKQPDDIIEQLSLPYDAEPIGLAVGQVWPGGGEVESYEILVVDAKSQSLAYRRNWKDGSSELDADGYAEFFRFARIPEPAIRPKPKLKVKRWLWRFENGASVSCWSEDEFHQQVNDWNIAGNWQKIPGTEVEMDE